MNTSASDATKAWRSPSAALWCLRIVILLQSIGIGGRYLLSRNESESDVYGWLFFDHGWPETVAQQIDDWGTIACFSAGWAIVLAAVIGVAIRGRARQTSIEGFRTSRLQQVATSLAAMVVAIWMLAVATTHMARGGVYAELTLGEQAVRFAAPLVLMVLTLQPRWRRLALLLLLGSSAITFLVHGYKAIQCYGHFTDLILLTDARLTGMSLRQSTAEFSLVVIGIIDIAVAVLLVATRWRWLAGYMVLWGAITAASRMTALGWPAWPETFIRATNWGVPLACLLLLRTLTVKSNADSEANADNEANTDSEANTDG